MDRTQAKAAAVSLLGPELAAQVTDADWDRALDASVTVDSAGLLPSAPDWTPTYEPYWAAAEALSAVAVRTAATGGVTRFTSEGATFEYRAPDLWAAINQLRGKSPITQMTGNGTGLGHIDVPMGGIEYTPRSWGLW